MVFLRLEDVTGGAECVVFNSTYANSHELCVTDRILIVKGRIDHKQEGETKLLAMEVAPFEAVAERKEVTIKIDARVARAGVVRDLALLVKDFPGDSVTEAIGKLAKTDPIDARTLAIMGESLKLAATLDHTASPSFRKSTSRSCGDSIPCSRKRSPSRT